MATQSKRYASISVIFFSIEFKFVLLIDMYVGVTHQCFTNFQICKISLTDSHLNVKHVWFNIHWRFLIEIEIIEIEMQILVPNVRLWLVRARKSRIIKRALPDLLLIDQCCLFYLPLQHWVYFKIHSNRINKFCSTTINLIYLS